MACPSSMLFWSSALDFSCSARRRSSSAPCLSSDSLAFWAAAPRSASRSWLYRCRILSSISATALSYSSVASGLLHRGQRVLAGSGRGASMPRDKKGRYLWGARRLLGAAPSRRSSTFCPTGCARWWASPSCPERSRRVSSAARSRLGGTASTWALRPTSWCRPSGMRGCPPCRP